MRRKLVPLARRHAVQAEVAVVVDRAKVAPKLLFRVEEFNLKDTSESYSPGSESKSNSDLCTHMLSTDFL